MATIQVIIIDSDSVAWDIRNNVRSEGLIKVDDVLKCLIVFCNSLNLMNRENQICVISQSSHSVRIVYPQKDLNGNTSFASTADSQKCILSELVKDIFQVSKLMIPSQYVNESKGTGSLSQALSKALCVINRQQQLFLDLQAKVLILQLVRDNHLFYNSMMNSIFSAQKMGVVVDGIVLGKVDSSFLQQACYLTEGIYLKPTDQQDFLQILLTYCLPDPISRKQLKFPKQVIVDFRASCFCHGQPVEFAYMCSVCLALTCVPPKSAEGNPFCHTCRTPGR